MDKKGIIKNTKNARSRYSNKKDRKLTYLSIIGVSLIVLLIIFFAIDESIPRNSYLKELKVCSATIVEETVEDSKYYVRVNPQFAQNESPVYVEDSWVEVNSDFFLKHKVSNEVGLLIANYDLFKPVYLGIFGNKGQKFEKNTWAIDEIYDDYNAAKAANAEKNYTKNAQLVKKKITKDGKYYFVLRADERDFIFNVDKEIYSKYSINSNILSHFKAIGDFVKILSIEDKNG